MSWSFGYIQSQNEVSSISFLLLSLLKSLFHVHWDIRGLALLRVWSLSGTNVPGFLVHWDLKSVISFLPSICFHISSKRKAAGQGTRRRQAFLSSCSRSSQSHIPVLIVYHHPIPLNLLSQIINNTLFHLCAVKFPHICQRTGRIYTDNYPRSFIEDPTLGPWIHCSALAGTIETLHFSEYWSRVRQCPKDSGTFKPRSYHLYFIYIPVICCSGRFHRHGQILN